MNNPDILYPLMGLGIR